MESLKAFWGVSAGVLLLVVAAASVGVYVAEAGPTPPVGMDAVSKGARASKDVVTVAGSGSNLPITQVLASAYEKDATRKSILLHESIGSRGAVRAVRDGAVDIGLISRAVTLEESRFLQVIPYARTRVVAVAHGSNQERRISLDELNSIYAGTRTHWEDGRRIFPLLREPGDSTYEAILSKSPDLARTVRSAWRTERFEVIMTDQAMADALRSTSGSIGLLDIGFVTTDAPELSVLHIEGRNSSDAYPFIKDLAFILPRNPKQEAKQFVTFAATSVEARDLMARRGYLTLEAPVQ